MVTFMLQYFTTIKGIKKQEQKLKTKGTCGQMLYESKTEVVL